MLFYKIRYILFIKKTNIYVYNVKRHLLNCMEICCGVLVDPTANLYANKVGQILVVISNVYIYIVVENIIGPLYY